MFSLQRLFGKEDKFLQLLEDSAKEAHGSVRLVIELINAPRNTTNFDDLVLSRRKEKKIAELISQELVETFITGIEREDIEALARSLYKIPKSAEKLGERFMAAGERGRVVDLSEQAEMMAKATDVVLEMVKQLRQMEDLEKIKELNDKLQYVEGEADKLMNVLLKDIYGGKYDPLTAMVVRDLHELIEKVIDRCRDVGNVVVQIILKNS